MRKTKSWVLLAALLLAVPALSACGSAEVSGGQATIPAPAAQSVQAADGSQGQGAAGSMTFQAVDVKNETIPLSEEEVLAAYDRAVTAFGWFRLRTLPCDTTSAMVDGELYQRVDYPGIDTVEDLRTYLRGNFSQEVIDRLLPENTEPPLYRDIDGQLYVIPTSRQPDSCKGTTEVMVEQMSADSFTVNVTVEILAEGLTTVTGFEVYSFPYQCVDGRWIFTNFKLVNEPS